MKRKSDGLAFDGKQEHVDLCQVLQQFFYRDALGNLKECKLETGRRILIQALTFDKGHIETWNLLGLVYYELGRYGNARRCWNKSLELEEGNLIAINYLRTLEQELEVLAPYLNKLQEYIREGSYKKAKKILATIPTSIIQKVDLLNYCGIIMFLCQDWNEASRYWMQSLKLTTDGMASVYLAQSMTVPDKWSHSLLQRMRRRLKL